MKNNKKILIIVLCVTILAGALIFLSADKNDPIVGTWEGKVLNNTSVYVFNKDGTYENFLQSTIANGTYGTYYTENGILHMEGNDGKTREIRYSVLDNTLILTTELGNNDIDVVYTRK